MGRMPREKETSDDVILREFLLHDDPVLVAKEVAKALDMSRQGIGTRLKTLEQEGMLNSKKPGRDRVFWLTNDGRARARESIRAQS